MAMALEELGFKRAKQKNLLNIDSKDKSMASYKYAMITGDPRYSQQQEIQLINHEKNNGELCKVVLITQAGSEGIDFKNLRQVHILILGII